MVSANDNETDKNLFTLTLDSCSPLYKTSHAGARAAMAANALPVSFRKRTAWHLQRWVKGNPGRVNVIRPCTRPSSPSPTCHWSEMVCLLVPGFVVAVKRKEEDRRTKSNGGGRERATKSEPQKDKKENKSTNYWGVQE